MRPYIVTVLGTAALMTAPLALSAQSPLNAKVDSTMLRSPSAQSALEARAILSRAIAAVGGLPALRAITSISTDRSTVRTTDGQGLRPGVPSVSRGIQLNRFDTRNRRAFTLRDQEIDGGQMLATGIVVTPDSGFDIIFPNRTYYSRTSAQYGNLRLDLLRGELPTLLLAAWNRPEQIRSVGRTSIAGRACDALTFADADGAMITMYFDATSYLPVRSEYLVDDATKGDAMVSTDYSDYRTVDALKLPFQTQQNGPGLQRSKASVTKIEFNVPLADSLFRLPKDLAVLPSLPPIRKIGDGVYALQASIAVEFADFVVIFDAYTDNRRSLVNIARLRSMIPSKPIRYVVSSHYHDDHLGGVREYAAMGANFITTRDAVDRVRANLLARHAMRPDSFAVAARNPSIEVVDSTRVIEDATQRLELYQIGPTAHVDHIIIAYLPKQRMLIEGDLLDMPGGIASAGGEDTEQFTAKLRALQLDVATIAPVHGSPATGTMQDLERAMAMYHASTKCSRELVTRLFCRFWEP